MLLWGGHFDLFNGIPVEWILQDNLGINENALWMRKHEIGAIYCVVLWYQYFGIKYCQSDQGFIHYWQRKLSQIAKTSDFPKLWHHFWFYPHRKTPRIHKFTHSRIPSESILLLCPQTIHLFLEGNFLSFRRHRTK